jgi:hypothetical protein
MTIEYPKKPGGKDKAIEVGKAAANLVPWVGFAVSVLGITFPGHLEDDEERWRREVTDRLNKLDRMLDRPSISQESLAWLMALLAAKADRDGTGEVGVPHNEWQVRFSRYSLGEIEEALAELSHAHWIECWSDANSDSGVGGFHATSLLFAHTHPFVHQLYPSEDARAVAAFALTQDDAVSAMQIQDHFQWEKRQLYPSLSYLADVVVPSGSTERAYHPDYPFIWLYLNGEVRRVLRRYVTD